MTRHEDVRSLAEAEPAGASAHRLRILATSDLHAAVLPFDYAAGREAGCFGLARTASLVAAARAEAPGACLLVDNGDFLQGTPLSDLHMTAGGAGRHPVIAAMNRLGYDAATLGNHEFNFGLEALRQALDQANFPIVCANALTHRGDSVHRDRTLLPPSLTIECQLADATGATHRLRIGILGLLPPQIVTWDRFHLDRRITARDMVETAAARVPMLRAQGADLVLLLAHTGIETGPARPQAENAALALARLPGVDAVIAGHSHEVFPRPGAAEKREGLDHEAGTFHGTPAVMPGFRGAHLGVIDLHLSHDARGWRVTGHRAEARPVKPGNGRPPAPADPAIAATVRRAHEATLSRMRAPLGRTAQPIHSYLSQIRSDLPVRLVAEAQRAAVRRALAGGPHAGLPVVSATAPFQTGGRAGPGAYTDIPAGPLTLRSALDLQPFPNTLCAVWLTGAELADWLERAASCFCQIRPGLKDQPLWDMRFPGHAADTVAGLTYRIDLTRPPLYDDTGAPRTTGPIPESAARRGRIRGLSYRGAPVAARDRFAMAINNYRAFGGGPYPALPEDRLIHAGGRPVRDVLAEFLRQGGHEELAPVPVWSFLPVPGATAVFETGPGLRAHPKELDALDLTDLGVTPEGFLRLRLPLFTTACESAV